MTKEARNPNDEAPPMAGGSVVGPDVLPYPQLSALRASGFVIHSSFVIRPSSFPPGLLSFSLQPFPYVQ
jgi:hypothetical protein